MFILAINIIQKALMKNLKRDSRTHLSFSNTDINKFILLLRKGVILKSTWMIDKSLMKHQCLKKKN